MATFDENIGFYTNFNLIFLQGARTDLAETLYSCKLYLGDLILKKSALAEHFDFNMIFMPHCEEGSVIGGPSFEGVTIIFCFDKA